MTGEITRTYSGNYGLDDRQWHPKGESVWVL